MRILEILETHQITKNPEQLYRSFRIACECGETFKGVNTYDATVSHRTHVAEVLEKHMQEREVEAKAEALAEAAFDLPAGMSRKGFYKWLRTRANQYKETE